MPKSTLKCTKCDRTFSMPAHLARHQSASHGIGGGSSRRRTGRGPGRPKGSGRKAGFAAASIGGDGASRIVGEMSAYHGELTAQREAIEQRISGLQNMMSMFGGGPAMLAGPARTSRRGRKGGGAGGATLKSMILRTLRQRTTPMSPQQIADAVVKGGYKTTSGNLTKAVSNALPEISEVKKVDRGQYSA